MSAPVITVTVNRSVAEIQLMMALVICVTSDGTRIRNYIISEHDVFTAQATLGYL
jgi:hypothetical protein